MSEFLGSVSPLGWLVAAAAVFGLATLPRALREMWTRPWKAPRDTAPRDPAAQVGMRPDAPSVPPPEDRP